MKCWKFELKSPTQPFLVGALFFSFNSLSKLSEPLTKHCQLSGVTRSEQNNWHHGSWRLVTSGEHLNSGHSSVVHLRSEHLLSSLTATLAFHKPRPVRGIGGWSFGANSSSKETTPHSEVVAAGDSWRVFYLFHPGLWSVINCDNVIRWLQGSVIISDRL